MKTMMRRAVAAVGLAFAAAAVPALANDNKPETLISVASGIAPSGCTADKHQAGTAIELQASLDDLAKPGVTVDGPALMGALEAFSAVSQEMQMAQFMAMMGVEISEEDLLDLQKRYDESQAAFDAETAKYDLEKLDMEVFIGLLTEEAGAVYAKHDTKAVDEKTPALVADLAAALKNVEKRYEDATGITIAILTPEPVRTADPSPECGAPAPTPGS